MQTRTSTPLSRRALGRAPATSPRPPVLAKGATSTERNKTRVNAGSAPWILERLVAEVAHASDDHSDVMGVGGFSGGGVVVSATGVGDGGHAGFDGFEHGVGKGKEAVGRHDATGGRAVGGDAFALGVFS